MAQAHEPPGPEHTVPMMVHCALVQQVVVGMQLALPAQK
jgi:hypothetical protein